MQENLHMLEHPTCYFSRKFNNAQRNYYIREKEVLGLILALQQFEFYITPAHFPTHIFTDHNPLVFLNHEKYQNQRLLRWSLALQDYTFNIHHIPKKYNVVMDT